MGTMEDLLNLNVDGEEETNDNGAEGAEGNEEETGGGEGAGEEQDEGEGESGAEEDGSGEGDSGEGAGDGDGSGDGAGSGDKKLPTEENETVVDFSSELSKRSGGKFKSYEDIEAAITDAGANAFANDMVAKLNDYVKGGGRAADFIKTQTVNFKEMSDLEAIKERSLLFDEGLTSEEVTLLMEEEFGVGENATDREKKLAQIKIKKAANAARDELVKYQEKWAVAPEATDEQRQRANAKTTEDWRQELSTTVDKSEEISFKIGEQDFKFKPSDDAKAAVKSNYDLTKFWDRYKTDAGYDVAKFVKDQYILNNIDDIISSIATFAKGTGTEEVIDEMKNPDLDGKDKKNQDGGKISVVDQVGNHLFS